MTRVPATLTEAQQAFQQATPETMVPLRDGYRYHVLTSAYGGVAQRWVLIYCWHRGHQIAERWRTSLHGVQAGLAETPPSATKLREEKILRIVREKAVNGVTERQLQQTLHLDSLELKMLLDSIVKVGSLVTTVAGKTRKFIIPREDVSQM